MKIKKPTSLLDILELQKVLDSNIVNVRERTLDDIKLSMIAEVIEFNEECKCSHKTWKSKPVDVDKMKEEGIDVLFFFAQMITNIEERWLSEHALKVLNKRFTKEMSRGELTGDHLKHNTVELIELICFVPLYSFAVTELIDITNKLTKIYRMLGMAEEEVYKIYFEKWQKNMERIGKEWN